MVSAQHQKEGDIVIEQGDKREEIYTAHRQMRSACVLVMMQMWRDANTSLI